MAAIITVDKLVKRFDEKTVLDGISLEIEDKQTTAIIGKSGVGKSVLLKCISGLLKPTSGEIKVGGICYHNGSSRHVPQKLSYLFQNNALLDSLTAYANVALPLFQYLKMKRGMVEGRVLDLFKQLDLDPSIRDRYPSELSGGMQKRLALARALALEPEIILFDEPTTGLDPERKNTVFEMIQQYQQRFGYTAVIVSHDIPEVLFVADRVIMVDNREITFNGTPLDLASANLPLADSFLRNRELLKHSLMGLASKEEAGQRLREAPEGSVIYGICFPTYERDGSPVDEVTRFAWRRHTINLLRQVCEQAVVWSPNDFELNVLTPPHCLSADQIREQLNSQVPLLKNHPPRLELFTLAASRDCCDPSHLRDHIHEQPLRLIFSQNQAPFAL